MTDEADTSRRRAVQIAAGAAVIATAGTALAAPSAVGIWRLAGATAVDANGNKREVPYGPRGMGLVTLTADGRMMAVLVDGRTSLAEGAKREYSSYCGNYTFDGSTLTTIVDAASDPNRMGSAQVRKVRFEGPDRMILQPPITEVAGVKVTRELAWERLSATSL